MTAPVVVIGGGYAGRIAAARMARAGVDVTLVDPRAALSEKVRLHHQAAGVPQLPRSLAAQMASVGATFVQGRAVKVERGSVTLDDGQQLAASHIALTLGVRTSRSLPGAQHTVALDGPQQATQLHEHVEKGHSVLIIGSGFTAIELAGALAPHAAVTLVGSALQATQASRQACAALTAQGVVCIADRVLRVTPSQAHLRSQVLSAGVIVRCTGTEAPPLARDSGLTVDPSGRAIAARDLSLTPWCSGAGDAITIPEMPWATAGCAVAMPMGAHLARAVLARLAGRTPPDFHFGWGGRFIEVGHTGVYQRTRRDGTERRASTHRAWWWTKKAILRYTTWAPVVERRTGLPTITALGDPDMPLLAPTTP